MFHFLLALANPLATKQVYKLMLACAVALLGAGCGGGDDTATAPDNEQASSFEPTSIIKARRPVKPVLQPRLTANAGPDQTAEALLQVSLDGSATSFTSLPAPTHAWNQTSGPTVQLMGANTMKPSFISPAVLITTTLTFMLTATSGAVASKDEVAVVALSDSPWGVAPSTALTRSPQSWAPAMVEAGVTTVRAFDHSSETDNLSALTRVGLTVSGFLWWSNGPVQSLPVNDLNGWRTYVTAQLTKFKGRIRHWEVWNEPPNFTDDKTPQAYAKVVASAYDAAKAIDPAVQIGLAAKSNHVNYLAQSIEAGAADKFDFITLHPYENADLVHEGNEGQFMSIVPRVRKMLLDKNPAKANVPIWFTEIGQPVMPADPSSEAQQADALVKIYTMAIAQGVARIHWFDPSDSEGLHFGLTAGDGSKRLAYFAMQTLSSRLGKRPTYLGWLSPGGAYYGFVFATPQGTVLSLWTPPGRTAVLPLSSAVSLIDPRSGAARSTSSVTVTDKPVLLLATTNSEQAQQWRRDATANKTKAFPWNGDHSASSSVSLTAGSQPNGIFARGMPAPTIVGGVSEFNLSGRNGQTFTVDPTFMSYTTSPIKITVVLRGHGMGDPGFNLKYESNVPLALTDGNGLTSAAEGWHRVTGTAFYEKSWTISNPRFVGFYGYNFTFDSDGPAHSQYSIQKITVSKL